MNNEELREFLKEHLSIKINNDRDYEGSSVTVSLLLDGELISSDYFYIETNN